MNIQGWLPLGLTGLISLLSKGLLRVFSSTTVWKHQFFGTQPSLWSNTHIYTWLLEKPKLWLDGLLTAKVCFLICCLGVSSVLLPGKSHGQRSLVGCSPWGCQELDTTERLHFPFSLSHIGERNGNPLQCSCLENPRDGGAWWAAVYGVAQSRTRLKWLSSSSSNGYKKLNKSPNRSFAMMLGEGEGSCRDRHHGSRVAKCGKRRPRS